MPRSGDGVQFALLDLVMQPNRLLIDINQTIILARKLIVGISNSL
jgi:hypothetical protein